MKCGACGISPMWPRRVSKQIIKSYTPVCGYVQSETGEIDIEVDFNGETIDVTSELYMYYSCDSCGAVVSKAFVVEILKEAERTAERVD